MRTSSVVRSRSPTNDSSASTSEKLAGMKTTKNAPTTESRLTTAVPPPYNASPLTPIAHATGMATARPTIATMRRSSLIASRRSRAATSPALCRSRLSKLIVVVAHYREVDVLQGRELAHLVSHRQSGSNTQRRHVSDRQRAPGGHDADRGVAVVRCAEVLGLVHVVRADHERAAVCLQIFEVGPRATRAVGV